MIAFAPASPTAESVKFLAPPIAADDSLGLLAQICCAMAAKEHIYTLGIEEEFAIVDPQTRELRSHIQEILEGGKVTLKEQIKPEMHQSVVELGTEICDDIKCAREHVVDLRSKLANLAGEKGLKIASVGTHPFSHWRDQLITEGERYAQILKDMQSLARAISSVTTPVSTTIFTSRPVAVTA